MQNHGNVWETRNYDDDDKLTSPKKTTHTTTHNHTSVNKALQGYHLYYSQLFHDTFTYETPLDENNS